MKRKLVVAIFAILFVGSMSTAAVALTAADDESRPGHSKTKADKADKGDGHGHRPPWAHHGNGGKPDHAWKDAWKDLTPAERAAKMAELAQKHADGMKKWATCVKDAGDNAAARAKCTKPLPPGLAKKQLTN